MDDAHLDTKLFIYMFGQMLRRIYAAVLSASASETEHKACKSALDVTAYVGVGQLVNAVKERKYFAVVLKKAYYRLVKACQLLVRLVAPGVVRAAAIEHIATPVAALVFRNALMIREAEHADNQRPFVIIFGECGRTVRRMAYIYLAVGCLETVGACQRRLFQPGELRQLGKLAQHIHKIWICEDVEFQQLAQVLHGMGNAVKKMLFTLEIAAEAVCAEHLERAEQHEQAQTLYKMAYRRHFGVHLQRIVILVNQLTPQLIRILGGRLPKERSQVIIIRAFASTLVIYEIRAALSVEHDVASLEVTVHEAVRLLRNKVFREEAEVCLKLQFVEIKLGRLQETILKIIQVEEHAVLVELRLGITICPVKPARTADLYIRQLADGIDQQLLLTLIVPATGLAAAADCAKQRHAAKVFLQITKFVVRHGNDARHGQLPLPEMPGKVNESVVLIAARANNAYNRASVSTPHAVITAVTARRVKLLDTRRSRTAPLLVQIQKLLHSLKQYIVIVTAALLPLIFGEPAVEQNEQQHYSERHQPRLCDIKQPGRHCDIQHPLPPLYLEIIDIHNIQITTYVKACMWELACKGKQNQGQCETKASIFDFGTNKKNRMSSRQAIFKKQTT